MLKSLFLIWYRQKYLGLKKDLIYKLIKPLALITVDVWGYTKNNEFKRLYKAKAGQQLKLCPVSLVGE